MKECRFESDRRHFFPIAPAAAYGRCEDFVTNLLPACRDWDDGQVFIVSTHPASDSFSLREEASVDLPDGRQAGVLSLSGRLDGTAQAACDRALAERVAAGVTCLVLDCADLEFVSSAGVRCFIKGLKLTRPVGGGVVICRPRELVRQVVELSGLGELLPMAEDLSAAARRF